MLFQYDSDGCTLSDTDKDLIAAKISKLEHLGHRLDDESSKVHVQVVRGTRHNSPNFGIRVQVTIPGHSLRAEASGPEIADAADEVERKLRVQIEKLDK